MFRIGDLLEIKKEFTKSERKILYGKYPLLKYCNNGVRCVVIESIDEDSCVVAPCDLKRNGREKIKLECCVRGTDGKYIMISHSVTFRIDSKYFEISKVTSLVVPDEIKLYLEKSREKANAEEIMKDEKKARIRYFQRKYEIASINNDKVTMQKIIDTLGYAPIGKGTSNIKDKISMKHINIKPYQGGGFSPK